MGREIKRVPVDFGAPLNEIWPGFLRPDELDLPECPDCGGSGYSPLARHLDETFYALDLHGAGRELTRWDDKITQAEVDHLIAEGRLHQWRLTDRVELSEPYELDEYENPIRFQFVRNERPNPTADEVNQAQRGGAMVHDAINRWKLITFRCAQQGVSDRCATCGGDGDVGTPEQRAAQEAWEPAEPPTGDGWQLWETTSEGSPTSPVFDDGEKLARWMSENPCGFAGSRVSYESALKWVAGSGWSPSLASGPDGLVDGITFVASTEVATA